MPGRAPRGSSDFAWRAVPAARARGHPALCVFEHGAQHPALRLRFSFGIRREAAGNTMGF